MLRTNPTQSERIPSDFSNDPHQHYVPIRWAIVGLLLTAACAGPAKKDPSPIMTNATVTTGADGEDVNINGVFLHLDHAMARWNDLFVTAKNPGEAHKAAKLEEDIRFKATRYQMDLIQALESGPPPRRQIAALALGFSEVRQLPSDFGDKARAHRVSPVPALLGALNDPIPGVVSNALLALGLQANIEMPTARMIELLSDSDHAGLRINASWTLRKLADLGAPLNGVVPVARRALADEDPAVRTQAALILARMRDGESISNLAGLLRDERNLPAAAAARSLAFIGSKDVNLLGSCARALVGGMGDVRPDIRTVILSNLITLSGRNYGDNDDGEWARWANNIP